MEKFLIYLGLLAPIIGLSITLLAVTIIRNAARRKAGKKRGFFE